MIDYIRSLVLDGSSGKTRQNGDRTGHVLIIDMITTSILRTTLQYAKLSQANPQDNKSVRCRQPWFVLASEWPSDGEDTPDDSFK